MANGRYDYAIQFKDDPYQFINAIADTYATDNSYASSISSIMTNMGWQISMKGRRFMRKLLLLILLVFLVGGCEKIETIHNSQESAIQDGKDSSDNQEDFVTSDEEKLNTNIDEVDTTEKVTDSVAAENYLIENVKELDKLENYIYQESGGDAFMVVESEDTLHDLDYEGEENEYFMVYVGEQHEDYKVNWFWFYVNKDLDEVLWYDLVEGEIYSLSEWRASSIYKEKFDNINK